MSHLDEPLDAGTLVAAASQILTSHAAGHTCQRCTPGGCDQVSWAEDILDQAVRQPAEFRKTVAGW